MNVQTEDYFNRSDNQASILFDSLKGKDPLPNIKPALLNSADIYAYAEKSAMIWPFCVSNLKSASYEVDFIGKVIFWNELEEKETRTIKRGDVFILKKHSIAFISPELNFRLPDYLAVRFNLQIKLVHSGILLGTGPLVDPGFEGNLLIPLHNLTNNDYELNGGEGLIWVEFTKLSENYRWNSELSQNDSDDHFVPFPNNKKNKRPEEFLGKALAGQKFNIIQSSIPTAITKAREVENRVTKLDEDMRKKLSQMEKILKKDGNSLRDEIQNNINNIRKELKEEINKINDIINKRLNFDKIAIGALIIAFLGVGASLWSIHIGTRSLVQDSVNYVKNNRIAYDNISTSLSRQNNKITDIENKLLTIKK